MIKLDIPLWCAECEQIKPIAEQNVEVLSADCGRTRIRKVTTLIRCKHEERCKQIYEYMEKIREKNKRYNEVRKEGGELI